MKQVTFKEAVHKNQTFAGTFQVIRGPYNKAGQQRDCMFKIVKEGAMVRVHAYNHDYKITGGADNLVESPEEQLADEMDEANIKRLGNKIRTRFKVLDKIAEGVVSQRIRSTVISGAAGIGKTFTLQNRIQKALDDGDINKTTTVRGRISAIALYAQLFLHKDEGDLLVLDDVDVFDDETKLDLLKGALDTTGTRHLSWLTASEWLESEGIDNEFDFNGSVVFITNKDFDRIIDSGSMLAEHVKALMSRSIYLDMGIHTPLEIMVRIDQVVNDTNIMDREELDEEQAGMLMDWLWDNFRRMREISIRSVAKIGDFIKADPDDWEEMAEVTQIRAR